MSKSQGHVEGAPEVAATGGEAISMTRRNFLRSSLGAAAFMAAPNILTPARAEATGEELKYTERVFGSSRYDTAYAVSYYRERRAHENGGIITSVLLVRADKFPDALASTPGTINYSGKNHDGVILLVDTNKVPDGLVDRLHEIYENNPNGSLAVTAIGGPNAISEGVLNELRAGENRYYFDVARIHGDNRAATAAELSKFITKDRFYIVPGWSNDYLALLGATYAGHKIPGSGKGIGAVLYCGQGADGKGYLPPETLDMLNRSGDRTTEVIAVGGEAIEAVRRHRSTGQITTEQNRIFTEFSAPKDDHYEMSKILANHHIEQRGLMPKKVTFVRGEGTPVDALSGGGLAILDGPLMFTPTGRLCSQGKDIIVRHGIKKATILGGPNAISSDTANEIDGVLSQNN